MEEQVFSLSTYSRPRYISAVLLTILVVLSIVYFVFGESLHPVAWIAAIVAGFTLGNYLAGKISRSKFNFTLTGQFLIIGSDQIALAAITDYFYKEYRDFDEFELQVAGKPRLKLSLDKAKESRVGFGKFYDALTVALQSLHADKRS